MVNKINSLFANSKDKKLLSLYFCAGCPNLDSTADVIRYLMDFHRPYHPWSGDIA